MPLLLLDLDNTVADRDTAFAFWIASKFPDWASDEPAARAFLIEQDADGTRPRTEFLAAVRERFGFDAAIETLLAEYRELTLAGFPAMSAPARDRLVSMRQAGWKLAVVTNGDAGVQEATATRIGLAPLLDACVVSGAVGITKPDPRIFKLAAQICGAALADAWMIGDSDADVLGAHRAGISSVWLTRTRTWNRADVRPDHTAESLDDALQLVQRSNADRQALQRPSGT